MSEKKVVEGTEEQVTKKPVAKASVKEEPAPAEEKKPSIIQRIGKWFKRNKKPIIAGVGGFGAGAATAVGVGMYLNKRDEKRQREQYVQQEQQQSYDGSLDPNV